MLLPIDTILRDHGVTLSRNANYQHTYEMTTIWSADGQSYPLPLDFHNMNRDVLLVFYNGLYQAPDAYELREGPVIWFPKPLTGEILHLVSIKSVKVWKEAPDARNFEDASIRLKKLDIGILSRLVSPEEKVQYEKKLLGVRRRLDDLSKDFGAIELRYALADRIRGGSVIADNFKTSAIGVKPLDANIAINAATSGQSIVTASVGNSVPFVVGEEVTLFDNASFTRRIIKTINGATVTFDTPLSNNFKFGTVMCRSMGKRELAGYNFFDWRDPVLSTLYQLQTYDVRYQIDNVSRFVLYVQTKSGSCMVNVFRKRTGLPEEQVSVGIKQVGDEMQAVVSNEEPATYIIRLTFNRANPAIMPNYVRLLGGYEV